MRYKIAFLMLLVGLSSLVVKAEEQVTLSFASTSIIDSIQIENMNNGTTTTLIGNDNLVFEFYVPVFIDKVEMPGSLLAYPNPFNHQMYLEYTSSSAGVVNLSVYALSSVLVAQISQYMDQGYHRFIFKSAHSGVYSLRVCDKSSAITTKVICHESSSSYPSIEYEGMVDNPSGFSTNNMLRQASVVEAVSPSSLKISKGDLIRFIAYSNTSVRSVYETITGCKKLEFQFDENYYKFEKFYIQTSQPGFVDIMFAVTDSCNKGVDYLKNSDFNVLEDNTITSPTETFRHVKKMQQIPYLLKTVLLIDNSSSVANVLESIKNAALKFIESVNEKQEISIYVFSDSPVLLQDFTTDKTLLEDAIKSIELGYPSTNLYGSTITGLSQWTDIYSLTEIVQGSLIIFTDGDDTQGSSTLNNVVNERKNKKIYVIGLGSELNQNALNQIANPGPYFSIKKATELDSIFENIQSDIVQYSNSFYWLNYLSPKRTGNHNLQIEAKNNTNVLDAAALTESFNANGFQPVRSGTYVNISGNRLYGLDTIRCFYSKSGGFRFAYNVDGSDEYSKDSLLLTPVTYWAYNPPEYSWQNDRNEVCMLEVSDYSNVMLYPIPTCSDSAIITLKDEANGYARNLIYILYSDLAKVTTATPKAVASSTATLGGTVVNTGKSAVSSRGICWSNSPMPLITDNCIAVGSSTGAFEIIIKDLLGSTHYYSRAYATNSYGTSYGAVIDFTTLEPTFPSVSTTAVSNIAQTSAKGGGTITDAGGSLITTRGICWNLSQNPTISDNKTVEGTGSGQFISLMTSLTGGTTYYVRAYAINGIGTGYGEQDTFVTRIDPPVVTTNAVNGIASSSAVCGGNVSSDGGGLVIARGVCWGNTGTPTINNDKTIDSSGIGNYTSILTGLTGSKKYYVRAYATNSTGTSYGTYKSFTTLAPVLATLTTNSISNITPNTASCGGAISDTGGSAILARGICWSTFSGPTTSNNKTMDNEGTGSFVSTIFGLTASTTYYVRAYVTNSIGTSYGEEQTFVTTAATAISLATDSISSISYTSAIGGGNIISDGGSVVIERGVCWDKETNPTASLSTKTIDGTGTGYYSSSITGLNPNTTYYIRAYATNSVGIAYGQELSFTTKAISIPTVTTDTVLVVKSTTAICVYTIVSIGGSTITASGLCWSTETNPTVYLTTKAIYTGSSGKYSGSLTNLSANTKYYIRAYATNGIGTAYGKELTFTTTSPVAPDVSTSTISNITSTSVSVLGVVHNDNGAAVTERGVCWSTDTMPTLSLSNKTYKGSGTGVYTCALTGLSSYTKYHVRAFASNSAGTAYGTDYAFITLAGTPSLTTNDITNISTTSATCGGNILSDNGNDISECGVCWSTSENPTVSLSTKTVDGSGTGTFISTLTELAPGTFYYVRAYAINGIGTSYGEVRNFSTYPITPFITTHSVTNISDSIAYCGGFISSDGGATVITRGICWSTDKNPTVDLITKTDDGTGLGDFSCTMTGLSPATIYHVRAYATYSAGTSYGADSSFQTHNETGYFTDVRDGTTYSWVKIGTQKWMAQNLAYLPYVHAPGNISDTSPLYYVNGYSSGGDVASAKATTSYLTYGVLYNLTAAKTACPSGWHLPTQDEWITLSNYLINNGYCFGGSGVDIAKSMASTDGWGSSSTEGTVGYDQASNNSSGFSAKPGGYRYYSGNFYGISYNCSWWSSSEQSMKNLAWYTQLQYNSSDLSSSFIKGSSGLSVRCVMDE